eukprot:238805_1
MAQAHSQEMESMSYTWNITDPTLITQIKTAKPLQTFKSPVFSMFNFRWFLSLYPNGHSQNLIGKTDIFLHLTVLPEKVKSMRINRKYTLAELDVSFDRMLTITHEHLHAASWSAGTVKTSQIQKCNQFTFKVDLDLFAVFDNDGNDITNRYLRNKEIITDPHASSQDMSLKTAVLDSIVMQMEQMSSKINAMQQQMNNMELRLNEEQKHDDVDGRLNKMMDEIKSIKRTVNALSANHNLNPKQQKVKLWLENKVELAQYFDIFLNNGIDELSVVALLDKATLKDIGIDVIGHQMKILNHAKKLQQKNQNEGGVTAYL